MATESLCTKYYMIDSRTLLVVDGEHICTVILPTGIERTPPVHGFFYVDIDFPGRVVDFQTGEIIPIQDVYPEDMYPDKVTCEAAFLDYESDRYTS